MGTSVDANGRSILHKGHGMTHTCAVPDVCKTPSPGGPVPIPYVNVAMDSNLADGASTVKIEGNPVAKVTSKISTSMGDEPGTAGGIISSKFKGAMTWKMGSLDVKAEGKSVVRFLDTAFHNGNTFNTSFINVGGTGLAYGDDQPCPVCEKSPAKHRVHETADVQRSIAGLTAQLDELLNAQAELIVDMLDAREILRILRNSANGIRRALGGPAFEAQVALQEGRYEGARAALAGQNVLRWERSVDTYAMGYMIGVCLCKCGAKALAAASGENTPGFTRAVADCGFELAPNMPELSAGQEARLGTVGSGPTWSCAAPKLIGALDGHKPLTIVEQYYQRTIEAIARYEWTDRGGVPRQRIANAAFPRPGRDGVNIRYRRTEDGVTTFDEETFPPGASAPSCDRCKVNLPEMLCDADELCP